VPEGGAVPLARMGCGAWCEEEAGGIEEGAPNMREHEINPPQRRRVREDPAALCGHGGD